jgi:CDP-glycerol glycerophosphotransferase
MLKQYPQKYDIIWTSEFPETCCEAVQKGIKVVKYKSLKHFWWYFTSRVTVTNDMQPPYLVNRKKQLSVNTWHAGMNYKKIGKNVLNFDSWIDKKFFTLSNPIYDLYISGSKFFTKDTAQSLSVPENRFFPSGLPRNDIFFNESIVEISKKIRSFYEVPDNIKILLFAPTFRKELLSQTYGLSFLDLIRTLEEKFGGKWTIFFRDHYLIKKTDRKENHIVRNVSDYYNMQELLCAADILISDYSSCMWDFALTGRPVFSYAPDIKSYMDNDRNFAYPLEKWPFSIATDNSGLEKNIFSFDGAAYKKALQDHFKDAGSYENGHALEKIAEKIAEICGVY